MNFLDDLPVATLVFIAGATALIVAALNDEIAFVTLYENLLYLGGACFGIGYVRNQAGKGVRR